MNVTAGDLIEGRYRIERALNTRSGAVFLAFDTGVGREIIMKFLPPASLDVPAARARFERELQIVANLRDPHTVQLLGYGEHEGQPYTLFEYLPGEDLAELIKRGPWSPAITQRVLLQVLSSLREAQRAGIIHREVSPENIRVFEHLTEAWNVKLLDFGLGRPTDQSGEYVTITAAGDVLGTPRYMSPEAIRGEPLTAASDIFSLGVVALEIVLGPDVFNDDALSPSPAAIHAALNRVPAPLSPILRRMLAPDPKRRLANADSVMSALRSVSSTTQVALSRQTSHVEDVEEQKESIWVRAIAGLTGVALVAAAMWYGEPPPKPRPSQTAPSANGLALVKHEVPSAAETVVEPALDAAPPRTGVLTGCGVDPPFEGFGRLAVETGPLSKYEWLSFVPKGYDPTRRHSLLLLVHGLSQSPQDLLRLGGFPKLAQQHNFIVIAPGDSDPLPWKDPGDQELIRMVVAATKQQLCIDEQRVFAAGHSQGGHVLELMMCEPWIRGLAFHSHRGSATARRCIERKLPLIFLHPKESEHLPFKGGANCAGQEKESVRGVEVAQQKRNGCTGAAKVDYRDTGGKCLRWRCDVPLESCHLEGGHAWPGVRPTVDLCPSPDPPPFPVAARIWNFFSEIPTQKPK